jgi:hypothetical protein
MPTTPFTIERFGGLRLDVDPLEAGATAATAISNVDLDISGAIRTRPGRDDFDSDDSATWANRPYRVVSVDDCNHALFLSKIVTDGSELAIYSAGAVLTVNVTAGGPASRRTAAPGRTSTSSTAPGSTR